jgi:hypothetical protein
MRKAPVRLNLPPVAAPKPVAAAAPKPVTAAAPKPVVAPVYPKGLVKALFIGINYEGNADLELKGCINDIQNAQILLRQLYPGTNTISRCLTDRTELKPTRQNILDAIAWLVADLKSGQNVYFHYSGHGVRILDKSGDEISGADSCICPYDAGKLEIITDDEIRALLAEKIPLGSKCFAVIDACNSGTAMDLQYTWQCPKADSLVFSQNRRYAVTKGNVLFLSACRDEQYAMDTVNTAGVPGGALTFALLSTWATYRFNMKVKHLLWNVRKYLKDRGYNQVPQLSSGGSMSSEAILDLSK